MATMYDVPRSVKQVHSNFKVGKSTNAAIGSKPPLFKQKPFDARSGVSSSVLTSIETTEKYLAKAKKAKSKADIAFFVFRAFIALAKLNNKTNKDL